MNLFCVGLSHHTANVETRERYARAEEMFGEMRAATGCAEAILLSTCNRVEVYAVAEKAIANETIARCLAGRLAPAVAQVSNPPQDGFALANLQSGPGKFATADPSDGKLETCATAEDTSAFYRHEGERCAQHLFRVVSGLDSMVVGETEVLGQAKQAYSTARESGGAGATLHRLFQRAFRVAKQVRTHTDITRGAVSVGSVAVELAGKIFGELKTRKVLVLGAGETSEKTARALASRGVSDLRVCNRSGERAEQLAAAVGGRAVPFVGWEQQCREIDILISSTAASEPLLTRETLAPILEERWDRPLFIIDIAVPRDVAPEVNEMDGVFLYDIDSLHSLAEQSLAQRRQQVAAAEAIIAQHVQEFGERWRGGWGQRAAEVTSPRTGLAEAALRASQS